MYWTYYPVELEIAAVLLLLLAVAVFLPLFERPRPLQVLTAAPLADQQQMPGRGKYYSITALLIYRKMLITTNSLIIRGHPYIT